MISKVGKITALALLISPLATYAMANDDWQIYGKWEATLNHLSSQDSANISTRIMADKAHNQGAYQWHLQANYVNASRSLTATTDNHYQLSSLASRHEQGNQRLDLTIDRLNTAIFTEQASWVIGRQAISLGQSLLFTPLALGNQLAIPSLDTEYAPGVDAISGDLWLAEGNLQLITAFGSSDASTANWDGSAILARYTSHSGNLEWAWQAGKINQAYQIGGGLSGDRNGIAYRLELAHTKPQTKSVHGGSFTTTVIGLGYQASDELHLELEYLDNQGAASALALARLQTGMLSSLNEALFGANVSYQLMPLLRGQVTHFKALTDKSQFTQMGLSYSISDNSNLILSSTLYAGSSSSEFGALADTHSITYRNYF